MGPCVSVLRRIEELHRDGLVTTLFDGDDLELGVAAPS